MEENKSLYCGKCGVELLEEVHERFNGLCPKCAWFAQLEMDPEEAREQESFKKFRPEIKAYSSDFVKIFSYLCVLFLIVFVFIIMSVLVSSFV